MLSSAVAREISKNLRGLQQYGICSGLANEILQGESWKKIGSTRYTNDKQITDHYAIIPTGQGLNNLRNLSELSAKVYETIVRRFLGIFYPPAVYQKVALVTEIGGEQFFSNFRVLVQEGYLKAMQYSFFRKKEEDDEGRKEDETTCDPSFLAALSQLQKGSELNLLGLSIKEGETSPPKRYTSGSMILAMENAGQLIEDEELREQIKEAAIGTSATRAEILKKLVFIKISCSEQKDAGYHPDTAWRNDLRRRTPVDPPASESGADGKLGKGTYLCSGRLHYLRGIYGKTGKLCDTPHGKCEAAAESVPAKEQL